jgi:hypothetical protein
MDWNKASGMVCVLAYLVLAGVFAAGWVGGSQYRPPQGGSWSAQEEANYRKYRTTGEEFDARLPARSAHRGKRRAREEGEGKAGFNE